VIVRRTALALALAAVLGLAGCGGGGDSPDEVVLVTHDSFALSKPVRQAFERETGLKLRILESGDAGEALNKALLTAGDPQGDVLFEPYESPELERVDGSYVLDPEHRVTPIDHGEVCLNFDKAWFRSRGVPPPTRLEQLTEPRYRGLLVVESPASSTPGLAFLLATIARFGEPGWQRFWQDLRRNDVLVVDGWEEAYTVRFSGSSGKGRYPIVVSYASSPPAEVIFAGKPLAQAPTGVVESSCFRQVELAGVLRGARNEEGAKRLIDFMLSPELQADLPTSMFVFPVREGVELPPEFARFAVVPERPLELPPEEIGANRERWIREWTDVVLS
jgi:thiamine transport system substrate-binding protein